MKTKHYLYTSLFLFFLIFTVGYVNKVELRDILKWSDRPVNWLDFQQVDQIDDEFDATIFSNIYCPNSIDYDTPLVYAFMDPNQSKRLKDSVLDPQLLKHEQYHFNITEYHARLLRKQIVQRGEENISTAALQVLYDQYDQERASMQFEYDDVSKHNVDFKKQRYWELKIDDLLRQTAYYKNPNVFSYYNYTKQSTEYYKHVYHTLDHQILTSYPTSEVDHIKGDCYKVVRNDGEVVVEYYKDGELTNGGIFKTAITKINTLDEINTEIRYYNKDLTLNTISKRSIVKTVRNENNDIISSYYDANDNPVVHKSIHKTVWKYDPKTKKRYSTYYDIHGNSTTNNDLVFHEKREFDNQGRTIKIANFDSEHKPMNDKDYVAIYNYVFGETHKVKRARLYDKDGSFAMHINEYNMHYTYDERGNLIKFVNLDQNGDQTENNEGICIYKYSYDIQDNYTSVKRYNAAELPVIGNDDYFMQVWDYDYKNRIDFTAKYYDGYVLAFDNNRNGATKYEYINDSTYLVLNVDAYDTIFENDFGFAIRKQHKNAKGEIVKEIFLDKQECFALSADGVEIHEYAYNKNGNVIQETRLDSLGKSKTYSFDISTTRWEYDSHNNKTKTTYYNAEETLANARQNVSYHFFTYNKDNLIIERTNYDKNMKPTLLDGVFRTTYFPNIFGQDTLVKEFNTKNKLIKGVSITRYAYNQYGKIMRQTYYNSKNQRTSYNSISTIEYLYDHRQRHIGSKYYNIYNQPTHDENGIFHEKQTLNTAGNITSYEYFNKKGLPTTGPYGYHKVNYEYNDSDMLVKESTYGIDLTLTNDDEGIAEYEYKRLASSLIGKVTYYDQNGNLTENSDGIAEITYEDTMNGLHFLDKQFNAKGEEINNDIEE
ncbi:hypothetical protein ACWGOQ_0007935 [Aquimarina sp. M1]